MHGTCTLNFAQLRERFSNTTKEDILRKLIFFLKDTQSNAFLDKASTWFGISQSWNWIHFSWTQKLCSLKLTTDSTLSANDNSAFPFSEVSNRILPTFIRLSHKVFPLSHWLKHPLVKSIVGAIAGMAFLSNTRVSEFLFSKFKEKVFRLIF